MDYKLILLMLSFFIINCFVKGEDRLSKNFYCASFLNENDDKGDVYVKSEANAAALFFAIDVGNVKKVDWLLKNGVSAGVSEDVTCNDYYCRLPDQVPLTSVILADISVEARLCMLSLLLEHGADVNVWVYMGKSPISFTSDVKVIDLLLSYGADINQQDQSGETALSGAVHVGDESLFKLLLEKGARADIKDKYGRTPIDLIKFYGRGWLLDSFGDKEEL